MKQSVSYYVQEGDTEDSIRSCLKQCHLDGIERLVYEDIPPEHPLAAVCIGCHLAFWPTWLDFYLGNEKRYRKDFPTAESLRRTFHGTTRKEWISYIKGNIRAALAENPEYLVWHVADCTIEEAWTWKFHYSSRDVLKNTANLFAEVSDVVPDTTLVLFENIFWPGLNLLVPDEVNYFFELIGRDNVGIMLDIGHLMNTSPYAIYDEIDGARYVKAVLDRLGELADCIRGIHLSCSLSWEYRNSFERIAPHAPSGMQIMNHITSIDQPRPFTTAAMTPILDYLNPDFLTHELFADDYSIPIGKVNQQKSALGI